MIIDSEQCWTVFDEENDKILFIFRNRDEALVKIAEFDDYSPYQIAKISINKSTWSVDTLSWKDLVLDLIRKSTKAKKDAPPQEVELPVEEI